MKVLLVVHEFLPRHITGTEQYVRALALGLRADGVDARVLAYEPLMHIEAPEQLFLERDELVDGIPVRRIAVHERLLPNWTLRDYENPLAGRLVARYLDEIGFDLVHVFHARNLGPAVLEEPKLRGIPVVVHLMDFWWLCPNYLLLRRDGALCDGPPDGGMGCIPCIDPALDRAVDETRIGDALRSTKDRTTPAGHQSNSTVRKAHALLGRKERLMTLLATADRVLTPSRFLGRIYREHGLPADRLQHLAYGIDPGRFVAMPARKPVPGRPRLDIGYIGSISRHKGVHVLLDAMRSVASDRVHLHIYGSRSSQPGFSEPLIDGIRDPRITFHGPFAPTELGRVLAGIDALAVPSLWYENTPFAVLEALHAGVPVLASDLGGIAEIVAQGENGHLFPAGNDIALGALLTRIANEPERMLALELTKPPDIRDNVDALRRLYAEQIGARRPQEA